MPPRYPSPHLLRDRMTVVVAAVLALGEILALLYNRLVRLRSRHDLIPNLVETVKGYLSHERQTFENVAEARAGAVRAQKAAAPGNAGSIEALGLAEGLLSGALGRLMAVVEAHPTLQADAQVAALREELTSTENRVAFSRQAYNDAATRLNTITETFPDVAVARLFGIDGAALLEDRAPEIHVAPRVALV